MFKLETVFCRAIKSVDMQCFIRMYLYRSEFGRRKVFLKGRKGCDLVFVK